MATYLSRSFTADNTSRSIFTVSAWIKRSVLSSAQTAISASTTSNFNDKIIGFRSDNTLEVNNVASGSAAIEVITNRVFRDTNAWYHIVVAIDTTQSAIADGVKLYVNGVRDTDFSGSPTYTQSATFEIGRNGSATAIGRYESGSSQYFGGYLADVHYIDGQQKLPTDFGETDSTTGIWKPKTYAGTYGNNGFLLEFKNAGALGTDTSGNSETFTVNGAGTNAQVTDTPSNNFVTMNPLANRFPNSTFTKGNLSVAMGSSQATFNVGTFGVTKGKWYFEMKPTALGSGTDNCLIGAVSRPDSTGTSDHLGESTSVVYRNNGTVKYNGTNYASQGPSFTTSDIIGVALDMDNNRITFSKNGQWIDGSGNADEANPTSFYTFPTTMQNDEIAFPAMGDLSTNNPSVTEELNFGNPTFTISSGNADAAGYGNFEYAVPSGYYAICTRNLNTYG
tara:strand:- start:438 stop:1787 length:1350 start_codon:yes stop_codon:yes gene_type:complete